MLRDELGWDVLSPASPRSSTPSSSTLPASPFTDPVLLGALQEVFRPEAVLVRATLRDSATQAVASLTLVQSRRRVGPWKFRILEGGVRAQASSCDLHLTHPDSDLAERFLAALRRHPGWELLECRGVPDEGVLAVAAAAAGAAVTPDAPALAIPLDDGSPILSASRARKLRQSRRRLRDAHDIVVQHVERDDLAAWSGVLARLALDHAARWAGTATPSPFADSATADRFIQLFSSPDIRSRCTAVALVNQHDGGFRGAILGFNAPTAIHAWRAAYDQALAAYSPGIQLLTELAHVARDRGCATLELGRGDDAYKSTWHHVTRRRWVVRWHRSTLAVRATAMAGRLLGRPWLRAWQASDPPAPR